MPFHSRLSVTRQGPQEGLEWQRARAAKAVRDAEEDQVRAANHAAHESQEAQARAAKAARDAEEDLQRAVNQAAHEAQEDQARAARKAAHEAHEAGE